MKVNGKDAVQPWRKAACMGIVHSVDNKRRHCNNDGVACWVSGEFGREAKMLCNACILKLRARGWKVRYQLEGDNPPDQPREIMPGNDGPDFH